MDLDGRFFASDNYVILDVAPARFLLQCGGATGTAAGVVVTPDQDGVFQMCGPQAVPSRPI